MADFADSSTVALDVELLAPAVVGRLSPALQERHGGRGGGPAAPATRRVHLTMLRALLTQLGLEKDAAACGRRKRARSSSIATRSPSRRSPRPAGS